VFSGSPPVVPQLVVANSGVDHAHAESEYAVVNSNAQRLPPQQAHGKT
jgi:hypothetical protein